MEKERYRSAGKRPLLSKIVQEAALAIQVDLDPSSYKSIGGPSPHSRPRTPCLPFPCDSCPVCGSPSFESFARSLGRQSSTVLLLSRVLSASLDLAGRTLGTWIINRLEIQQTLQRTHYHFVRVPHLFSESVFHDTHELFVYPQAQTKTFPPVYPRRQASQATSPPSLYAQ